MRRARRLSARLILAPVLIILAVIVSGCGAEITPATSSVDMALPPLAAQPGQFYSVVKDGVEVACPKYWQTYSSDPSLVYGVSRADTIRIVIGVLPAIDQSYYDGLVAQELVRLVTIAGYRAYRNDYTYSWNGHQVTSICVSAIQNEMACHFMFLCDTSALTVYQPIFEFVMNSLKFL